MKRKKWGLVFFVLMVITSWLNAGPVITLQECQELALRENSELLRTKLETQKTSLIKTQSASDLYPSVSGRLSTSYSHTDNSIITTENSGYTLSGTIRQNVFYPGLFSGVKAAKISEEIAGLTLQDAISLLETSVINYYFSILASNELIVVYKENIRFAEENIKRVQTMMDLGVRTESDLLKVKVQKGQFETQLINEEQRNCSLLRELNLLMGRDPSDELTLQPLEPDHLPLPTLEEAREMITKNNYSLLTLQKQMDLQKLSVKMKKESYLPTIAGDYTYSYRDDDGGTMKSQSVGVSANITLFEGFHRKVEKQKAEIDLKALEIQYKNSVDKVFARLDELYQVLETYQKLTEIHTLSLESAQRDYNLITQQVELGAGTILDQLDAQISVLSSKSQLVQARYNTKITEANINQLLGK
ncbi:MAG: TolC family protein [Candidatus Marinimicrobia bacterium]|nr:TolC family protein [Candidatus Neomarinimicrobiota bacterium]